MSSRVRPHLRFANVVSLMALFVALGGTSYAALVVTGKNIKDGTVTHKDLKDGGVTGIDVKNSSLAAGDFAPGQLPAGAAGPKGDTGPDGAAGPGGPAGPKGDTGATGTSGSPDTPSQVLGKLVQADGSGSGLDADVFDGLASTAFQRRGTATACGGSQKVTGIGANGDVACGADVDTPNADTLDGHDSTAFPKAYMARGAYAAAAVTHRALTIPGFGGIEANCDDSTLTVWFTNLSGGGLRVFWENGAAIGTSITSHNFPSDYFIVDVTGHRRVIAQIGRDTGAGQRLATVWMFTESGNPCEVNVQAIAQGA